ncbi:MAG: HDIG domain-containing protein [Candidatus Doudnabacteria bacterium]|nr:HDIG domain-containing protein [Candidatus Doudnabacteria bacterium]
MLDRSQAYDLMREWVSSESLRKHMLCVEAAMRGYARKYGEDEELWGMAGLMHDFDYEKYPQVDAVAKLGHPFEGIRHLQSLEYPEEIVTAILGHALYSGVPRESNMAKCLFACDELCGFLVACAHMRPDKFETLTAESVKKKLKDKKFAAKVSREDIALGIQELAIPQDEHIDFVIGSLKPIANQIF